MKKTLPLNRFNNKKEDSDIIWLKKLPQTLNCNIYFYVVSLNKLLFIIFKTLNSNFNIYFIIEYISVIIRKQQISVNKNSWQRGIYFNTVFYLHLVNFISQFWKRCKAEILTFRIIYLRIMSSNRYLWQYTWHLELYLANLKPRLHQTKFQITYFLLWDYFRKSPWYFK